MELRRLTNRIPAIENVTGSLCVSDESAGVEGFVARWATILFASKWYDGLQAIVGPVAVWIGSSHRDS